MHDLATPARCQQAGGFMNERKLFLLVSCKENLARIDQRKQERRSDIIAIDLIPRHKKLLGAVSWIGSGPFQLGIDRREHVLADSMRFATRAMQDLELVQIFRGQDEAGKWISWIH